MDTEIATSATSATIPVIEETTGDGINKNFAKVKGYLPPTEEPIKYQKALTSLTEVWVTGNYSDLVDIMSNRACVWRDYIRQDSTIADQDIQGNDSVIAVRCGRMDDLLTLYGVVYVGGVAKQLDVLRFYVRDGRNINVAVQGLEVFVEYGNQKDLHTRFLYDNGAWKRSPGNNRGGSGYPLATEPVASARVP